jgi:hypothetical protein
MDQGANGAFILIGLMVWFVIVGIPVMKVLNKAGFSRVWVLLAFIPILNIIFLWIFAFVRWPTRVANVEGVFE